MKPALARAIKIRHVTIARLEKNPPNDMTPEQVKNEIASCKAAIARFRAEADAEK